METKQARKRGEYTERDEMEERDTHRQCGRVAKTKGMKRRDEDEDDGREEWRV